MSKIVINSKLAFKQDSYNTSPCVVEKVIGLPESEFSELKNHTLKDNCYIKQYKDLMGYRDNAYHCLFLLIPRTAMAFWWNQRVPIMQDIPSMFPMQEQS